MRKHVDLYATYVKHKKAKPKKQRPKILIALLFITIGVAGVILMVDVYRIQTEISTLESNVEVLRGLNSEVQTVNQSIQNMEQLNDALEEIVAVFDAKHTLSGDALLTVLKPPINDITITDFVIKASELQISFRTESDTSPSDYVKYLKTLDCVSHISYLGYTRVNDGFVTTFSVYLKGADAYA